MYVYIYENPENYLKPTISGVVTRYGSPWCLNDKNPQILSRKILIKSQSSLVYFPLWIAIY